MKDYLMDIKSKLTAVRLLQFLHFILLLVYLSLDTFIPPDRAYLYETLPVLIVSLAAFVSACLFTMQSSRPRSAGITFLTGVSCGILVYLAFTLLLPRIPSWNTFSYLVFILLTIGITCYRMPYVNILRAYAFAMLVYLTAVCSCALAGAIPYSIYTERDVIRTSLGTSHPNSLSLFLLYLVVTLYLGKLIQTQWINLILSVGLCLFCNYITHTRTTALFCCILVVFQAAELLLQKTGRLTPYVRPVLRVLDYLAVAAFPLNCILWFGLIAAIPHGNGLVEKINDVLAGRLSLANGKIRDYGVTLFGKFFQDAYVWVDNGYTELLLNIGVIGIAVYCVLWTLASVRFLRKGQRHLLYAFAGVSLYGGSENIFMQSETALFFWLAMSDLSSPQAEGDDPREQTPPRSVRYVRPALAALLALLLPALFTRMRTVIQLSQTVQETGDYLLRLKALYSFALVFLLWQALSALIIHALEKRRLSRMLVAVVAICAALMLPEFIRSSRVIRDGSASVQALIDADKPALDLIRSSKTGSLYCDPYPLFYRKQFPGIRQSLLSGKELARMKNATVITDALLDGGNTFQTQGFQYAEISDAHAVYTNDSSVIQALNGAGYTVTPFFSRRFHIDLAQTAENTYLTYEPAFPGIFIDQAEGSEHRSDYIWTNYNTLYEGDYEATFVCRLLMAGDADPASYCMAAVNYSHSDEIASARLTPADMDESGYITITVPFTLGYTRRGEMISFSVYGGNIRHLIVEDISYVRTN